MESHSDYSHSLTLVRGCRPLLTADKREIKDCPKLPSATSFIRKTLGESAEFRRKHEKRMHLY